MVRSRFFRSKTGLSYGRTQVQKRTGRLDGTASKGPMARVLTYNVHRWLGTDRQIAGRIAEVIASCEADIVALQEVRVGRSRTGAVVKRRLAAILGMNSTSSRPSGSSASSSASRSSRAIGRVVRSWTPALSLCDRLPSLGALLWAASRSSAQSCRSSNAHLSPLPGAPHQAGGPDRVRLDRPSRLWRPAVLLGDFNAAPVPLIPPPRLAPAGRTALQPNGELQATFHPRARPSSGPVFVTPSVEVVAAARPLRPGGSRPITFRCSPMLRVAEVECAVPEGLPSPRACRSRCRRRRSDHRPADRRSAARGA